ncbi:MAG: N-6 DNA methylase, partial [Candidatus Atribacteria bacterium]|nr:N-6 DNA methylase [Candidatus Atribacteria bacterium]
MTKKTKLPEKSVRIPETRESNWETIIPDYLHSVTSQVSESAKSHRFLILLKDLFGIQPEFIEDYVSGIEKFIKVRQKDRILRGEVDNLFGNLIIEFERDLKKKLGEAEEQLKRYVACLWSQETVPQRRPYLCLATDGVNFSIYSPIVIDPEKTEFDPAEINLNLIEQVDWFQLSPSEVYFWLDRYFLRKEKLTPRSEDITKDFGVKSHAFQMVSQILSDQWEKVKDKSEFKVIYDSWEKYIQIVYGSDVGKEELFCRHTYLGNLTKLMIWTRLSESKLDLNDIAPVLSGQFFKRFGVENFLEEDLFSWVVREEAKETGLEIARMLLSLLNNYNLRELSEDVLKSLYQELVDPKTRHDLGEFYTPDWLAHKMVKNLFKENLKNSLLDPSCGSGTFLYFAIKEKRDRLSKTKETLEHILNTIYGIDIHPLAVIIAKANYLFALGDIIKKRTGKISIPIYLSDALRLPEQEVQRTFWIKTPSYKIELDGKTIYLPDELLKTPSLYDEGIEAAKEFAEYHIKEKDLNEKDFLNFLKVHYSNLVQNKEIASALFIISEILREFIIEGRDTIWAFILKNIYKPLFLKGKFDIIVGNPPWLSFRYVDAAYQNFLRDKVTVDYKLLSGRSELITHLELGTLFFVRTADLYLKEGGKIAFVLPKSIFSADQHDGLRKGNFKDINLRFLELWDLENVTPLFNVPACVLYAERKHKALASYPVPGLEIKGNLDYRNSSLMNAQKTLAEKSVKFYLHKRGKRSFWTTQEDKHIEKITYYKRYFSQGATIVPRSFWFVEIKSSGLWLDISNPLLESSERARREAKNNYKGLVIQGKVENKFLYFTLLSTDLIPFGHLDYRLVILPIESSDKKYKLISIEETRSRGFFNLAVWLEKVQDEWQKRRGKKSEENSAIEWLNYRSKLTSQNPGTKYLVLYADVQRIMFAIYLSKKEYNIFKFNDQELIVNDFIIDYTLYYYGTNKLEEAQFLCSVLNSSIIDQKLGSLRKREQKSHPHVGKKIFDVASIPKFDDSNSDHIRLAAIGEQCTEKVAKWIKSGGQGTTKSIGVLRRKVREMLSEE